MTTQIEHNGFNSIDEALCLLDTAAKTKASEVSRLIDDGYQNLRDVLTHSPKPQSDIAHVRQSSERWLSSAKENAAKATKDAMVAVDENAKRHPWAYVVAAMATGAVLGYMVTHQMAGQKASR